jgi:hypothetical protein
MAGGLSIGPVKPITEPGVSFAAQALPSGFPREISEAGCQ